MSIKMRYNDVDELKEVATTPQEDELIKEGMTAQDCINYLFFKMKGALK